MKPNKFGRHRESLLITPRQRAIRHYMIFRILPVRFYMNDKGGDLKGSMQHFT